MNNIEQDYKTILFSNKTWQHWTLMDDEVIMRHRDRMEIIDILGMMSDNLDFLYMTLRNEQRHTIALSNDFEKLKYRISKKKTARMKYHPSCSKL